MREISRKACLWVTVCCLAASVVGGGGILPDLEANPVTGFIESVDLATSSGDRVHHVEDPGQEGTRTSTLVSSGAAADPRLAVGSDGDTWVVWWVESAPGEVRFARRDVATGTWTDEVAISGAGEDGRRPELVHDGTAAWVAYEIAGTAGGTDLAVTVTEGPEPFPTRTVIATTGFSGGVDLLPHSESGAVWVTWVDSAVEVGWSEYDAATGSWSPPQYQSYSGTTVAEARREIRDVILGP